MMMALHIKEKNMNRSCSSKLTLYLMHGIPRDHGESNVRVTAGTHTHGGKCLAQDTHVPVVVLAKIVVWCHKR